MSPGHAPEPSSEDDPDDDVPIRDLMRQALPASTGPRPGSSLDRPVPSGNRPASSGSRPHKRRAPSVPARARSAPATAPPVPATVPVPPAPVQSVPVTEATALRLALAMERVGELLETWLGRRAPPNDDDADVDRV